MKWIAKMTLLISISQMLSGIQLMERISFNLKDYVIA